MTRPQKAAYGELILPIFTQWEKVGSATGILQELEQGNFYTAALLCTQMFRDDRIYASFNTRFLSVLGKPLHMEPQGPMKRAAAIADDAMLLWPKMAQRAELITLLKWGLTLGVGIARKEWLRSDGGWIPTIKTWHPGALRFDLSSSTYMLRTQDQGEIPIIPGDPNWILFTPYGHKYARTENMLRCLVMLYFCRQWGFRDRARHSEVHGQGIRQLITPAEADQKDKDTARRAVQALGTETVVVTPQGAEGNRFDVKHIESLFNANEVFGGLIDHVDDCIAIVVLGQKSSTKGQGGLGAQEKPGEGVRVDIMRFDAGCIGDLGRESLLADWADYNYPGGARELAPTPTVEVDPPEDGAQRALEYVSLSTALPILEKYGVDIRKVLEQTGLPMLSEAEAAAKREEIEQKAVDMFQPPEKNATDDKKPQEQAAAG